MLVLVESFAQKTKFQGSMPVEGIPDRENFAGRVISANEKRTSENAICISWFNVRFRQMVSLEIRVGCVEGELSV